ncbi:MAG: hypothetical protein JSV60_05745 [Desulfobacterales bacterium]|jgi:type II secretory pathway component GspD/PulD (secretin)|nr:MAG: hypothetical protein JSV60_05745 [Desulfobacterales bacterium]
MPNIHDHRVLGFLLIMFLLWIHPHLSDAQAGGSRRDPIVIRVVQLDYANAEHLASVLSPLLSKDGRIVPYAPTNTLIIKDRASLVQKLVTIIKGPVDTEGISPNS